MILNDYRNIAEYWTIGKTVPAIQLLPQGEVKPRVMKGWNGRAFTWFNYATNPLAVAGRVFDRGWGIYSGEKQCEVKVVFPRPVARLSFLAGLNDDLELYAPEQQATLAILDANGKRLAETPALAHGSTFELSADLLGASECLLQVTAVSGHDICADFLNPLVEYSDGSQESPGLCQDEPATLQIDFNYGGEPFDPDKWQHEIKDGNGRLCHEYLSPDQKLKLEIEVRLHDDFHVIELIPTLTCLSAVPTEIISDFISPRFRKHLIGTGHSGTTPDDVANSHLCQPSCKLHRILGSQCSAEDYTFCTDQVQFIHSCKHYVLDTNEGRSSAAWLPFFQLEFVNDQRVDFAVGWSGAWNSHVQFLSAEDLEVTTGLRKTNFRLYPGEAVRQPSCAVHFFSGSLDDCRNDFRKFMIARKLPRDSQNNLLRPPVSLMFSGSLPNHMLLKYLELTEKHKLPIDVFWVDAGWYGVDHEVAYELHQSDWAFTVGNWRINQCPHPGGFRPVTDEVHRTNRKFLLWLEAERAVKSTPIYQEHPEYFYKSDVISVLLNLGREDARKWITDTVCNLIETEKIDCYREDFNYDGIPFWDAEDTPERIGAAESKFVTGLYLFWGELRRRFPDLLIDNCASGGRRIDLETCSMSLPLWRSDFQCFPDCTYLPEANQTQFHGLSAFIPFHCAGTAIQTGDTYGFLSGAMGSTLVDLCNRILFQPDDENFDFAWLRQMLELTHRLQDYLSGSYDCLTPDPWDYRNYYSYELFDEDKQAGALVIFRRPAAKPESIVLPLRHLAENAKYRIEESGQPDCLLTGAELAAKAWQLSEPRSVKTVFFSRM